jgi:hypothetical protein
MAPGVATLAGLRGVRAMRGKVFLAAALLLGAASVVRAAGPEVPFPLGYRAWTHIKSGWIGEGSLAYPRFGGMHHIYANPPAMTGYRTGAFPVGSVLVFDLLETRPTPGMLVTGDRRFRDVMMKSADGWRFSEFKGDSHTERNVTTEAGVKACAACHEGAKQDHVFSTFTETDDR